MTWDHPGTLPPHAAAEPVAWYPTAPQKSPITRTSCAGGRQGKGDPRKSYTPKEATQNKS
ncbi:MAG TPA: hypothetical protein PKD94_06455 [Ignavibacteria bacterium]|nr:hypothetical protein [Ignavibacteria bacterium]